MTCPTCADARWMPAPERARPGHGRGPCPACNDNGQRPIDDPDPSLKEIVEALPEGHAAKAQYEELRQAFILQQVRAGRFLTEPRLPPHPPGIVVST